MSNDRKILRGFLGSFGLAFVDIAVAFLQFRLLVHYLTPMEAGIWLLFLSIGGYVVFFDLGLGPTLGREISFSTGSSQLTGQERTLRIRTLIYTCTCLVSGLAVLVILLGVTGGWEYLRTTIPPALLSPSRLAWNIYLCGVAINLLGQGWFAGIYGLGHVFTDKLLRSAGQILGMVLLLAALWFKLGLPGLAAASVLQAAFTVTQALMVLRRGDHGIADGHFDAAIVHRLAMPSLKYAAMTLGAILIMQTDNLVIASMMGSSCIPNYQAVSRLVTTLMSLSMMLVGTTVPFQSQAYAQGNLGEVKHLLHRNLRFSLGIMVILGSALACFADDVIEVWLGPGHFVGFAIVWIFLLVMLLETHHVAMATTTMATGRIVFLVPALLAGVLNLVFSILLAHIWGLLGVALGTMCAQVITNNWYVPWYTMRQFHLKLSDHLRRIVAPILVLLVIALSVGYSVRVLLPEMPALARAAIGACIVGLAGSLVSFFILLADEEKSYIIQRLKTWASARNGKGNIP
jgi:O-antigen/teichoic acid export membrane protein